MQQFEFREESVLALIKENNLQAFEYIFREKYEELFAYSLKITRQKEASEELVQDVFVYLWENRNVLEIKNSLYAYLYSAVKHRSIDFLRSKYARLQNTFVSDGEIHNTDNLTASEKLQEKELAGIISKGLEKLPEKCKIIFLMSRESGLTYKEIANTLGVSDKTVKAQVAIALKKMRDFLETHWDKIIFLIISAL